MPQAHHPQVVHPPVISLEPSALASARTSRCCGLPPATHIPLNLTVSGYAHSRCFPKLPSLRRCPHPAFCNTSVFNTRHLSTPVGLSGLEPLTPALSAQCSNLLSYRPFYRAAHPAARTPASNAPFAPARRNHSTSALRPHFHAHFCVHFRVHFCADHASQTITTSRNKRPTAH